MKKQKINNSIISTYRVIKKIRNDWGNINPVTKIIPNKKKNYIDESYFDEYYDYPETQQDFYKEYDF